MKFPKGTNLSIKVKGPDKKALGLFCWKLKIQAPVSPRPLSALTDRSAVEVGLGTYFWGVFRIDFGRRLLFSIPFANSRQSLYRFHKKTVSESMVNECIFCQIPKEEIVAESDLCLAFYDQFPVSPGHLLIIPKRHVAGYFDLTEDEVKAMQTMLFDMKKVIEEVYKPDGFNIGVNVGEAAGQSIFHVHMHLIPRYEGDVEYPRGGVRGVIPEKQNY